MVFNNLCVLVHWTKVASALEGLKLCTRRQRSASGLYLYGILLADDKLFIMVAGQHLTSDLWAPIVRGCPSL